jgi:hypothetical protein
VKSAALIELRNVVQPMSNDMVIHSKPKLPDAVIGQEPDGAVSVA